ncbi:MAG: response regulator [Pseudomonadota bacterium]
MMRVLVVDDNPVNQDLFARQLGRLGYEFDTADNGEDALIKLATHTYDVVLADLQMPRMDGYELLRRIRANARNATAQVPVIAVSAHDASHSPVARGFDDYLVKPVAKTLLDARIRAVVGEPNVPDEPAVEPLKSTNTILNVAALLDLIGNDRSLAKVLLVEFRQQIAEATPDWQMYVETPQAENARQLAHRLKSSALSVGAFHYGEVCKTLEHQCQNAPHAIEPALRELIAAGALTSQAIDAWLSEHNTEDQ